MKKASFIFGSILAFQPFSANSEIQAGFDCRKAETIREKTICSDAELAALDVEENRLYQEKLEKAKDSEREEIKKRARQKLTAQNDLFAMKTLSGERKKEILKSLYKHSGEFEGTVFKAVLGDADSITADKMADLLTLSKHSDDAKMQYLIYTAIQTPEKLKSEPALSVIAGLRANIGKHSYTCHSDSEDASKMECSDAECLFSAAECFFYHSEVKIPCEAALKNKENFDVYSFGGRNSFAIDKTTCSANKKYKYPEKVEKYIRYINQEWDTIGDMQGSMRYAVYAVKDAKMKNDQFFPDFKNKNISKLGYPLERWALLSYPNFKEWKRVLKDLHEFDEAQKELAAHYVKKFGASEKEAEKYARYALTPFDAENDADDKTSVRSMILNDVSSNKIFEKIKRDNSCEEPSFQYSENDEIERASLAAPLPSVAIARPDVLTFLLERGDDCGQVDATDFIEKTPLMYAAQFGFLDSVKVLIEHGADINRQTASGGEMFNDGRTALMYALQEGHADVAKYLATHGADLMLTDSKGRDAYDYLVGTAPEYDPYSGTKPGERHFVGGLWSGSLSKKVKGNPRLTERQIKELTPLVRPALYEKMYVSDPLECDSPKTKADQVICIKEEAEKPEFLKMAAVFREYLEKAEDKQAALNGQNEFKTRLSKYSTYGSDQMERTHMMRKRAAELKPEIDPATEKYEAAVVPVDQMTQEVVKKYLGDKGKTVQTPDGTIWKAVQEDRKIFLVKFDPVNKKELKRYFLYNAPYVSDTTFKPDAQQKSVYISVKGVDKDTNPHMLKKEQGYPFVYVLRFDTQKGTFAAQMVYPNSVYDLYPVNDAVCLKNSMGCDCYDGNLKKLVYASWADEESVFCSK